MSKKFIYLVFIPMFVFLMLFSQSCGFFKNWDEHKYCGGDCKPVVEREILSPDGKMKAVLFRIDCPAGGGASCPNGIESRKLSILAKDANLPADEREGNAVNVGKNLEVKWIGDRELLVGGDYDLDKNQPGVSTVEGVTVRYCKFQTKIELISEVPSPNGKDKAIAYRLVCKHPDSDQLEINTIEVGIYGAEFKTIFPSNSPFPCEKSYLYGTTANDKISLKWNGDNELIIFGSQPDGEKGLRNKKFGERVIKYQTAE